MKHWSTFVVTIVTTVIFGGMMIANINGLVYNVCTSDGPHGINSLLPQNISYTGVSIKVLKINPGGSLDVQVSSNKKIKDIILWAESRENSEEQHIGGFDPIVGHAYAEGCSGYPNSTITNYDEFIGISQIVYEWKPPIGTTVILTHPSCGKKKPHRKHHHKGHCSKCKKKCTGKHHHKHKDDKKHHCKHEKNHHRHKNNKTKHLHKDNRTKHHHKDNKTKHQHKDNKKHHPKQPHAGLSSFTFKGVAFLENEPFKFYAFSLDKPIYIRGYVPVLNSQEDSQDSSLSYASSTASSIGVHVGSFDNTTSAAASNLRISGRNIIRMTITSFLAGILLIS